MKILKKIALGFFGLLTTLAIIFYYNLDMKLMYYVVVPFLTKHYDSRKQSRKL